MRIGDTLAFVNEISSVYFCVSVNDESVARHVKIDRGALFLIVDKSKLDELYVDSVTKWESYVVLTLLSLPSGHVMRLENHRADWDRDVYVVGYVPVVS